MKNFFLGILVLVVLAVTVLFFGRNILARSIVINGIQKACGMRIDVSNVSIDLPNIVVNGLKIYNPPGFSDPLLADIPKIYINFDFPAYFKSKVHLRQITLYVKELGVILNERGNLNVNSLALLLPKKDGGKSPEVRIDELAVKIDKVGYKSYLPAAGARAREFNPGIDETLRDVTDPSQVARQIIQRVVAKIGIANFLKFDMNEKFRATGGETGMNAEGLKKIFEY